MSLNADYLTPDWRSDLIMLIQKITNDSWDVWARDSKEHTRLKEVAIKFCEEAGHEPDLVVMGGGYFQQPTFGAKKSICFMHPIQPQWVLYLSEAETAIKIINESSPS